MSAGEEGGYVTRGRAAELQRHIDDLEQSVDERFRRLEARIEEAVELELELAKARVGAELGVVRLYAKGDNHAGG